MEVPNEKDFPRIKTQVAIREAEGHWFLIIEKDIASPFKRWFWETTEYVMAKMGHPCCEGNWFWELVIPDKAAMWLGKKFADYAVNKWQEIFQIKISKAKARSIDPWYVEWVEYLNKLPNGVGDNCE